MPASPSLRRRELLAGAACLVPASLWAADGEAAPAQRLDRVLESILSDMLADSPEAATRYGLDVGSHAALRTRLDDRSPAAAAHRRDRLRSQLQALRSIDAEALDHRDLIDLRVVAATLGHRSAVADSFAYGDATQARPYVVSHLHGAYVDVPEFLSSKHPVGDAADADAYLDRVRALGGVLRGETAHIRRDAGLGVTPPSFVLDRMTQQMTSLRDQSVADAPVLASFARKLRIAGLPDHYAAAANTIWREEALPALDDQISALRTLKEPAESDGIWRLPKGDAYYAASLQLHITAEPDIADFHRTGIESTAELSAQLRPLLAKLGYTGDTISEQLLAFLTDPVHLYPNTHAGRATLIEDVTARLDMMRTRLPRYFRALPQIPFEIRRVPEFLESGAPIAYYEDPALDGSRPGTFYLNLGDTSNVPRWVLPTTAFHEAIPGHHLQQVVLQESSPVRTIRKILWSSGYGEGWGLYAEQLAGELGMYDEDPVGRAGYLLATLLRAARMVADTGIHALRWSREQAATWMIDNGVPPPIAANEVERYCVWPGQACSYLVGKRHWTDLRARAEKTLGPRFDIHDFHAATLSVGAVPLSVLEQVVDRFIVETGKPGRHAHQHQRPHPVKLKRDS